MAEINRQSLTNKAVMSNQDTIKPVSWEVTPDHDPTQRFLYLESIFQNILNGMLPLQAIREGSSMTHEQKLQLLQNKYVDCSDDVRHSFEAGVKSLSIDMGTATDSMIEAFKDGQSARKLLSSV